VEPIIVHLEELEDKMDRSLELRNGIQSISDSIISLEQSIEKDKHILEASEDLTATVTKLAHLHTKKTERVGLVTLVKNIEETEEELEGEKDWSTIKPFHTALVRKLETRRRTALERMELLTVCNDIKRLVTMQNSANEQLSQLKTAYAAKSKLLEKCDKCGALKIYWES